MCNLICGNAPVFFLSFDFIWHQKDRVGIDRDSGSEVQSLG